MTATSVPVIAAGRHKLRSVAKRKNKSGGPAARSYRQAYLRERKARRQGARDLAELRSKLDGVDSRIQDLSRLSMVQEEKLKYLSQYDPLTGLPNRLLFIERLAGVIALSRTERTHTAVTVVDITRFHLVNDTFGREAGDALLRNLAERLRTVWHQPEHLARIAANTFALIGSPTPDAQDPGRLAALIQGCIDEVLSLPFMVGDTEVRIAMTAGVAVFPPDGNDAETLLRNAGAAEKRARGNAEHILFYQPEMNARMAERLSLENKLRRAVESGEFLLHYQPKVAAARNRLTGVEALIRWQERGSGLISPASFVPLLEETGLILPVGAWVMRHALAEGRAWRSADGRPLRVAVNVSPLQVRHRDFVDNVRIAVESFGEFGCRLDLEITETTIMQDIDATVAKLHAVRKLGVNVAVDDFGTGYSSLGYLAKLPVNALKVDRSFVAKMVGDPQNSMLVATIISLAHSLDMKVIAEGVETEEQATLLRVLKCDELQGFLISRPLPAEGMGGFLEKWAEEARAR